MISDLPNHVKFRHILFIKCGENLRRQYSEITESSSLG